MTSGNQKNRRFTLLAIAVLLGHISITLAASMGTAFTYQGSLMDKNKPANGLYNLQFKLYDGDDPDTAIQLGAAIDKPDINVIDGHFVLELNFGNQFDGNAVFLQTTILASPLGSEPATLTPLLELTPSPYALYAKVAATDNDWNINGDDMSAIPNGTVILSRPDDATGPALKISRSFAPPIYGSTWMSIYSTSIDTYWKSLETKGASLTLNANSGGNVGIGTQPSAKLHVGGAPGIDGIKFPDDTLQTTAAPATAGVPIGSVIDWWRPNDSFPVPTGYTICDGRVVNDSKSPFDGETLPDLRNRFVRGAYTTDSIGIIGGDSNHTHTISGTTNSKTPTMTNASNFDLASATIGVTRSFAIANHKHTLTSHSHDRGTLANSYGAHLPPYMRLLKIMRTR